MIVTHPHRYIAVIFCCVLGSTAMAEDTPEIAELKAQKVKAEAERDLANAELEKIRAEQKLTDAKAGKDAATAKANAEAQTALYNQQKAQAEAQAAALGAEATALKNKYGAVTGSTITGTVTASGTAGTGEANLLAAQAVDAAAAQIARAMPTPSNGQPYIVFAGQSAPSVAYWRVFRIQVQVVNDSFDRAKTQLEQAKKSASKVASHAESPSDTKFATESVAAAVTGAGAVLDLGAKLGSYFMADYNISGATIAGSDHDLLAISVLGRLRNAWYPARWTPQTDIQAMSDLLKALSVGREESVDLLKQAQDGSAYYKTAAEKEQDPKKKGQYSNVAAIFGKATDTFVMAQKRFDDLLTTLAAVDKDGTPIAARVVEQKQIADALEKGALAVFVRLNSAAGSYYTKKSLWTFFGSMPFSVSGGAVASYVAIDGKTGTVQKAGQFSVHSGYHKVNDVADRFLSPVVVDK